MKTEIKAEIVADSLSPQGDRLTSLLATLPVFLLKEFIDFPDFSINIEDLDNIPFEKIVDRVNNDSFIPIAWQKEYKGMQGSEYWGKEDWVIDQPNVSQINVHNCAIGNWLQARDNAVSLAKQLNSKNVTKQLCNRLLEPFMWTTMLITGSKEGWDNFFSLRCPQYYTPVSGEGFYAKSWKELQSWHSNPKNEETLEKADFLFKLQHNKGQSEIHMMMLSEKIYDAIQESVPEQLSEGMWYIPFMSRIDSSKLQSVKGVDVTKEMIKISTAMADRTSYTIVGDEKEVDYSKMIELHDRLITQNPPNSAPTEHCCICVTDEDYNKSFKGEEKGWFRNYKGFKSYRQIIESDKN